MARIAGINIPQNKVVSIALTYIHGIGPFSSKKICEKLNIPTSKRVNELILSFYGVKPLLTIYLDIELQEAIKRIENREKRKVSEEEEKILRKAKLLYEKHSNEMKVINSNKTMEEVSSEIENLVKNVI